MGCGDAWRTMNWRMVEGLAARGRELKQRGHCQRHQGVGVARGDYVIAMVLEERRSMALARMGLERDHRLAPMEQDGRGAADCWRQGGRRARMGSRRTEGRGLMAARWTEGGVAPVRRRDGGAP